MIYQGVISTLRYFMCQSLVVVIVVVLLLLSSGSGGSKSSSCYNSRKRGRSNNYSSSGGSIAIICINQLVVYTFLPRSVPVTRHVRLRGKAPPPLPPLSSMSCHLLFLLDLISFQHVQVTVDSVLGGRGQRVSESVLGSELLTVCLGLGLGCLGV